MLVMTKKKSNLSDSVDYQNAGPKMHFLSVISHARGRCLVTSEYVMVVKAMHTASKHNILL